MLHNLTKTFVLLLAVIVGCVHRAPSTSLVVVSGRVVDATSGRPLHSVTVTLADRKTGTNTDSHGAFSFRIPRPGNGRIKLLIRYVGYEPLRVDFSAQPDSVLQVGTISIKAAPIELDDLIVTSPRKKP